MKKIKLITISLILLFIFTIPLGCSENNELYSKLEISNLKQEKAEKANNAIRIMSANTLVHIKSWGGTTAKPRAEMFGEVINHYLPDVIGLQEFCGCWYNKLPQHLPDYELLNTKKTEYTTMMYNKKTVKLIEQGIFRFTKQSNKNCRYIVWGLFEKIETKERFIATSTHLDFGMSEEKKEMRSTQITEFLQLITSLEKNYPATPIYATGDYNFYEFLVEEGSEFYSMVLNKSKLIDTKFISQIEIRLTDGADFNKESLDHIFTNNGNSVKLFGLLASDFYNKISDHSFIFIDAII